MNNLILGSSGFFGKRLVNYLKNKDENVVEFDIKNDILQDARKVRLPLDNIDRIFVLAWDVGGAKYLYNKDNQLFQMEWNNDIMNNIFPQILNLPFVFISSQLSDNVDTVYGVQKRMGEVWTKLTNKGIAVRFWNLYGYNENYSERSHVVSDFIYQAINYRHIKMITDGSELRQYIHIDDACDGLIQSFNIHDRTKTYDISSGEWVKVVEIANIISEITGCKISYGTKTGETLFIKNKDFIPDWAPKIKLREGLERMVKEFKNV